MKANYVQKGENIDFKNETTENIEAGQVVVLGDKIGVSGNDITIGKTGELVTVGVFKCKKDNSKIEAGKNVYYNAASDCITINASHTEEKGEESSKTTETVAHVKAGFAIATAEAEATNVLVKINA